MYEFKSGYRVDYFTVIKLNSSTYTSSQRARFEFIKKTLDVRNLDAAYVRFIQDNSESDILWIISSHIDIPAKRFAQTRVFSHIDGDKLFLNCPQNQWYQQGIPGTGKNIEKTINTLKKWLKNQDYKRVICVGHSMGAYMALVLGKHLNADFVVSTSPELILGLEHSRSDINNVIAKRNWSNILDNRVTHSASKHLRQRLYFGAYDPIDAYFLSLPEIANQSNYEIYEVPHHHGVTEYFTSQAVYLDILQDFDGQKIAKLLETGVISKPYSLGTRLQYRKFYEAFVRFNNRKTLRSDITEESEWKNAGWQHLRAKILQRDKLHAEAHKTFLQAFLLAPKNSTFLISAIKSALRMQDTGSLRLFKQIIELNYPRHDWSKNILDQIEEAISSLKPQALSSDTKKTQLTVDLISLSTQGMPEILNSICEHYQISCADQTTPNAVVKISSIRYFDEKPLCPLNTSEMLSSYGVAIVRHPVAVILSEYALAIKTSKISAKTSLTSFSKLTHVRQLCAFRLQASYLYKRLSPKNIKFVRYEKFKQLPKFAYRDIAMFLSTNDRGYPHPDLQPFNLSPTYSASCDGLNLHIQANSEDIPVKIEKFIPSDEIHALTRQYRSDIEFLQEVSTIKVAHWLRSSLEELLMM